MSPLLRTTLFPYTTLFRSICVPFQKDPYPWVITKKICQTFDQGCGVFIQQFRGTSFKQNLLQHHAYALCSWRSEEHTSELQSRPHLVCRLLLEKKHRPLPL